MIANGIALGFILKRRIEEHRQWMTRSFAVALFFLQVRVIGGVTGFDSLDVHANETIVWFCLTFSILFADVVLQWQHPGRSTSLVPRHSLATPQRSVETPSFSAHSQSRKQRSGTSKQ
jgi:hypothetical protein